MIGDCDERLRRFPRAGLCRRSSAVHDAVRYSGDADPLHGLLLFLPPAESITDASGERCRDLTGICESK